MDTYYLILFVAFLLCFFDFVSYRGPKLFVYCIFCFIIIFLISFRKIGNDNDSPMYESMFYIYSKSTISELIEGGYGYVEKGYTFLNKFIGELGGTFRNVLMVMAIATAAVNYSFFVKKTNFIFISLLAYLSFFLIYRDFTQIRYGLCAAFCFWCIDNFIEKKYVRSLVFFLLAFSFHNSALILLPALPFLKYFKNKNVLILLPIPCFILGSLVNFFPLLLIYGYSNAHMDEYLKEEGGGGYAISIFGYFLILIYYIFDRYSKKIVFTENQNFYFRILAFSVSLNLLFVQSAIFQRFTFILFQCSIIVISILLFMARKHIKRKENFFILYFCLSVFYLIYGIRIINPELIRPYEISFSE